MLNVAIIVPSLARAGPVIVAKNIAENLKGKVYITFFFISEAFGAKIDTPFHVERLSLKNLSKLNDFDIVHSHGLRPDIFNFLYFVFFRPFGHKNLNVSTLHSYFEMDIESRYGKVTAYIVGRLMGYFLWPRFSRVVVLTNDAKDYYKSMYGLRNCCVIWNGVDISPPPFSSISSLPAILAKLKRAGKKIIGTNCALVKLKGVDKLICAMPYLDGFHLVVAGAGPELNALIQLSKKLGVEERCCFLGFQSDISKVLPAYDVFALASEHEGFSLALAEAAAFGVPICCAKISPLEEIYGAGGAIFFDRNDPKDIAFKIAKAFNMRSQIGALLVRYYDTHLTASVMAAHYFKLYTSKI